MNAASNIVNQIADLEIDRRNKPDSSARDRGDRDPARVGDGRRPLRALASSRRGSSCRTRTSLFASGIAAPLRLHAAFFIYCIGALATFVYSLPAFGRTKRHWFAANFTIAVTRGGLLKVAGWSFVATVLVRARPWAIGGVFALFLLGATSTKDFSDMEGDRAHGCITLPVRFGVRARGADHRAVLRHPVAADPAARPAAGSRRAPRS